MGVSVKYTRGARAFEWLVRLVICGAWGFGSTSMPRWLLLLLASMAVGWFVVGPLCDKAKDWANR